MMIVKMTNKDDDFYSYMGKFLGSRIVQTETKDRIYDDNNKTWYIYLDKNERACAFISVHNDVIKNVYSSNDNYLKELILEIKKDFVIKDSIVTNIYQNVYLDCDLQIIRLDNYKHFIMIRGENNG